MFPVRCYTCDSIIAQHWATYSKRIRDGWKEGEVLKSVGQSRMCCRRMFLSYVDLIAEQKTYPCVDVVLDSNGTVLKRKVSHTRTLQCD